MTLHHLGLPQTLQQKQLGSLRPLRKGSDWLLRQPSHRQPWTGPVLVAAVKVQEDGLHLSCVQGWVTGCQDLATPSQQMPRPRSSLVHGHSGMEDRAADGTCTTALPNPDQESSKASPTSCLTWAQSWISRDHGTPDAPISGGRVQGARIPEATRGLY